MGRRTAWPGRAARALVLAAALALPCPALAGEGLLDATPQDATSGGSVAIEYRVVAEPEVVSVPTTGGAARGSGALPVTGEEPAGWVTLAGGTALGAVAAAFALRVRSGREEDADVG